MSTSAKEALAITPDKGVAGRVKALDWERVSKYLDARGCAMIGGLITPEKCDALAKLYSLDGIFRSRVVMARHGFGRSEYKYTFAGCPVGHDGAGGELALWHGDALAGGFAAAGEGGGVCVAQDYHAGG